MTDIHAHFTTWHRGRVALIVALATLACDDGAGRAGRATLPATHADAFHAIGARDAGPHDAGHGDRPDGAGPDWQPPLKLAFEAIPHDAPLLRATDLVFLPDAPGDFLWLDKDGDVNHMRLVYEGGRPVRAKRLGGFHVPDIWIDSDAGLISVALAPDYPRSHHVYFGLTVSMETSLIRRYTFDAERPEATPQTGVDIFEVTGSGARRSWHNIGSIGFTDTGDLFAFFGEKTLGRPAQDSTSPLGSMVLLRPRPEGGADPAPGNPFADTGGDPFVYAKGMRSPWKGLYHDGRFFFGDVGQDKVEEIDVIDEPGLNFGWPRAEGPCATDCEGLTEPFIWFGRESNHPFVVEDPEADASRLRAVYAGLIYRTDAPGAENDPYLGRWRDVLVFGDMSTGFIRGARVGLGGGGPSPNTWAVGHLHFATAMAQAPDGSVYATALGTWPIDVPNVSASPLLRAVLADGGAR